MCRRSRRLARLARVGTTIGAAAITELYRLSQAAGKLAEMAGLTKARPARNETARIVAIREPLDRRLGDGLCRQFEATQMRR
jgi:hypothetical protein